MKRTLIIIGLTIILLSFISAVPPFQQSECPEGLTIQYPPMDLHEEDQYYIFNFHVFNSTNGLSLTNNTVDCTFHLYNSSGIEIFANDNLAYTLDGDFYQEILGANFSVSDPYSYITQCNSSSAGGYVAVGFQVTPNGEEATVGKAVFYIGLLFLLIVFLTIAIYGFISSDQIWQRAGGIGSIYLLLIAISFLSWNMAADFLTSSAFLITFLRIMFLVLIIGLFPFLIILFAYGVYMAITTEEIEKMMEKGVSFDEASSRVKSKRKIKW